MNNTTEYKGFKGYEGISNISSLESWENNEDISIQLKEDFFHYDRKTKNA